ncbi:MAG: oligosaccharide flippase family protein [Lactobacillaceae bacterium]|nr:oligosaccharide flippase family protein [Lactobacillaceae bacterium]
MTEDTHTSNGIRREMTYDEVTALLNGKTLAEVLADNPYQQVGASDSFATPRVTPAKPAEAPQVPEKVAHVAPDPKPIETEPVFEPAIEAEPEPVQIVEPVVAPTVQVQPDKPAPKPEIRPTTSSQESQPDDVKIAKPQTFQNRPAKIVKPQELISKVKKHVAPQTKAPAQKAEDTPSLKTRTLAHFKKAKATVTKTETAAPTSSRQIKVTEVSDTYDYHNRALRPEVKHSTLVDEQQILAEDHAKIVAESANLNSQSRMLRGSLWMTLGNLFSRLLGALYIIPWTLMLGAAYSTNANGLYAQGYQIYAVALLIATAGLPNVLARLVAEYAAKKQFGRVKFIFRQSLFLGGVMGIISALLLYMLAGPLSQGNANVVPVIRSLAAAVLVIPVLSMLRGYVQGFEFMSISATSQVVEQLVRVVYMLGMTGWIMLGHNGNWVDATVQSTFAAFWGALAGIVVVLFGIWSRKNYLDSQFVLIGVNGTDDSVMWKMMRQSLPVIFAGSAIALVQVVDQFTFFRIMKSTTHFSMPVINQMFAQFAFNSNKLVMLVVSLAVAMSETALPMLSRAKAIGNPHEIGKQIVYAFKLLAFVMLPASLGIAAVAHPLYVLFYGSADMTMGVLVLEFASYVGIFFGFYMVVLAIYQGIGDLKFTVKLMALILVVKLLLQYPIVKWLDGMGPLITTLIAFAVGLIWAVSRLVKRYPTDWSRFNYSFMLMLFWSLVVFAVVSPVVNTINIFVNNNRSTQLIVLLVGVLVGGAIYGIAALKTHLGVEILGERIQRIADKLPF